MRSWASWGRREAARASPVGVSWGWCLCLRPGWRAARSLSVRTAAAPRARQGCQHADRPVPRCARVRGHRLRPCGGSGRPAIDLLHLPAATMRKLRGRRIAMIFQDASKSLNPVLTIRDQVAEVFYQHRASDLLADLGDSACSRAPGSSSGLARAGATAAQAPPFRSQAAVVRKKVDDLVARRWPTYRSPTPERSWRATHTSCQGA